MKSKWMRVLVLSSLPVCFSCKRAEDDSPARVQGVSASNGEAIESSQWSSDLTRILQIKQVSQELYNAVRQLVPSRISNDELIDMLASVPKNSTQSAEELAEAFVAMSDRVKAVYEEAKSKTIKADPNKVQALFKESGDEMLVAVFGYSSTQSKEFLASLAASTDPAARAWLEYFEAKASQSSPLHSLEKLANVQGIDTAVRYAYIDALLKSGNSEEALRLIEQIASDSRIDTRMFDKLQKLRNTYLTDVHGLTAADLAAARFAMPAAPPLEVLSAAQPAIQQLISRAKDLSRDGNTSDSSRYAAAALNIAQTLETSNDLYVRLFSLGFQSDALDQIAAERQQDYLTTDAVTWKNQLNEQKVEYQSLDRFLREKNAVWKVGGDRETYDQYLQLSASVGQVEALRELKRTEDANTNIFDPSSVSIPK